MYILASMSICCDLELGCVTAVGALYDLCFAAEDSLPSEHRFECCGYKRSDVLLSMLANLVTFGCRYEESVVRVVYDSAPVRKPSV